MTCSLFFFLTAKFVFVDDAQGASDSRTRTVCNVGLIAVRACCNPFDIYRLCIPFVTAFSLATGAERC